MQYLEFEKPIEELNNKLIQARELADLKDVDVSKTINDIENQILKAKKEIYNNLSPWQKVQLSRHPRLISGFFILNHLINLLWKALRRKNDDGNHVNEKFFSEVGLQEFVTFLDSTRDPILDSVIYFDGEKNGVK